MFTYLSNKGSLDERTNKRKGWRFNLKNKEKRARRRVYFHTRLFFFDSIPAVHTMVLRVQLLRPNTKTPPCQCEIYYIIAAGCREIFHLGKRQMHELEGFSGGEWIYSQLSQSVEFMCLFMSFINVLFKKSCLFTQLRIYCINTIYPPLFSLTLRDIHTWSRSATEYWKWIWQTTTTSFFTSL